MNPETLARLQDLKAIVSTIRQAELRVENATNELKNADLNLARVQSSKRALTEALQNAVEAVVRDISLNRPAAESLEPASIVRWFTNE